MPTSEIRADWAAQRIKNLSFFRAAWSAFFGNRGDKVTSLISEFNYPRYGPGQMWEQMTTDIEELGGKVLLNHRVTRLEFDGSKLRARARERRHVVRALGGHLVAAAAQHGGHGRSGAASTR